jgi:hypothetical protein
VHGLVWLLLNQKRSLQEDLMGVFHQRQEQNNANSSTQRQV